MKNGTFAPQWLRSKCSIFHNILKNLSFQRRQRALVCSKGLKGSIIFFKCMKNLQGGKELCLQQGIDHGGEDCCFNGS